MTTTWTYWRRWISSLTDDLEFVLPDDIPADAERIPVDPPQAPLVVGAIYRRSDGGEYQTWAEGQWVRVPGQSIGPLTTEGDPMLDRISEAEAERLTGSIPRGHQEGPGVVLRSRG